MVCFSHTSFRLQDTLDWALWPSGLASFKVISKVAQLCALQPGNQGTYFPQERIAVFMPLKRRRSSLQEDMLSTRCQTTDAVGLEN